MKADALRIYKIIKKCPRLLSIIDAARYPMTPAQYKKTPNMPNTTYINAGLKKLRILGVFRLPVKTGKRRVHILTETGMEIEKIRCKDKQSSYFDPAMKDSEYKLYSRIADAGRRKKIINALSSESQAFTQIYKKTDLLFQKANNALKELVSLGIVVQEAKGIYKLNKLGIKIRDFLIRIEEINKTGQEIKT